MSHGSNRFYDVFDNYLGAHPVYGPIVSRWRETLERRVAAGNDWPIFLMKPEITYNAFFVRPDGDSTAQ